MILHTEFILYVSDQKKSAEFYAVLLSRKPDLDVPGMTEFILSESCKLGLMPNTGIAKIITPALPHPDSGYGIPRCELYLKVSNVNSMFDHAISAGAKRISEPADRDWGDRVCYISDPDGHVIAFASPIA